MVTIMTQVRRRTAIESRIEICRDLLSTMRSTDDVDIGRQSSVTIPKNQVYLVPDFRSKGRHLGGGISNVSARGKPEVGGGVSRVVSSWDSSPPPTTTSSQGSRVGWHKGRRARKIVFWGVFKKRTWHPTGGGTDRGSAAAGATQWPWRRPPEPVLRFLR